MAHRYADEPQVRRESLRALIKAHYRFQSHCAKDAGISAGTLGDIVHGRRNGTRETLRKIADALGVPLAAIADDLDEEAA